MAKTPGFTEYVDDRDATIVAQLRDNDPRTKSDWFEVSRVDANGVTNSYLLCKANYNEFKKLIAKHDAEFNAWLAGGEQ